MTHTSSKPQGKAAADKTNTTTIHTTLYDLIAAISSEVGPENDALVTATIVRLLRSGRIRFTDDPRAIEVLDF